jgi:hypothetical protein
MNARIALILVVLLALLGGGALVYYQQERDRRPANVAALGQPLFADLRAAEIASIRITAPKATLTLEQKEGAWTIAERNGFPADVAKVRGFVLTLIGLKVGQSEPIGDKDRARLNLDASGTQVQLSGTDAKALARLVVGKKYFTREADDPEKAPGDGRFVALPDSKDVVYVVSDPLTQASARTADWIDRTSFQVENVKTLELRYPDGSGWRIERPGDNSDWKLVGARPDEKLDVTRANSASYSLRLLELADVAPKDLPPAETGLEHPTLINATTLDGLAYSIRVGKLVGDDHYVSFTSSGATSAEDPKLEERLGREKLLSGHVLLIPRAKLEDTLRKRSELLEKTDDNKK